MSNYSQYFFGAKASIAEIETMQLSHPSFSATYWLVRNWPLGGGCTCKLEDGTMQPFQYYPMKIVNTETATNLDQTMQLTFGDLGQLIPQEIDRIRIADTFNVYPTLVYRTYRSDDLNTIINGPHRFIVKTAPRVKKATTLNVGAPALNQNSTGERYKFDRFTGLRANQ